MCKVCKYCIKVRFIYIMKQKVIYRCYRKNVWEKVCFVIKDNCLQHFLVICIVCLCFLLRHLIHSFWAVLSRFPAYMMCKVVSTLQDADKILGPYSRSFPIFKSKYCFLTIAGRTVCCKAETFESFKWKLPLVLFLMLDKAFSCCWGNPKCDQWNNSYWAVLSSGTVQYALQSAFAFWNRIQS